LGGAELGHWLPGRASSRDDGDLQRNSCLCIAVAPAVSGREQRRKDCSYDVAFTGAMWNSSGECVEFELGITWTELKWTTVIAAVEINKAVSPIVLQ